jgi:hypothetical protein
MSGFSRYLAPFLLLAAASPLCSQQVLLPIDISPDDPSNYTSTGVGNNAAGRIKALVVDPNDPTVVYAAAEFSGIWKSTTGAVWEGSGGNGHSTAGQMKWFQASDGLGSGLTAGGIALAIDKSITVGGQSQRLLYATLDDDGRPTASAPQGGLWVSTNAATSWFHVNLCSGTANIVSVAFAAGPGGGATQPYVSTACGIWTTTNTGMDPTTWQQLPPTGKEGTSNPPADSTVVDGGFGTLFACNNTLVYQATDAGASGNWNVAPALSGPCFNLTAAPNGSAPATTVVVIHGTPTNQEVSTVNFGVAPAAITNLSYPSRPGQIPLAKCIPVSSCPGGSGQSMVAAPPITSASGATGPGVSYDVYASDNCVWYAYNPGPPQSWTMVSYAGSGTPPPSTECGGNISNIHVDPWAMAFPNWYDTGKGLCGAYAATDGGVFFSAYQQLSGPIVGGCTSNWITVQHDLHVLYSDAIYGITAGSDPFTPSGATHALYLPTQDNDTFGTTFGWGSWVSLNDNEGDSNQALVDPAFPNQAMLSRNGHYNTLSAPPYTGGSLATLYPSFSPASNQELDWGDNVAGTADLAQVMTVVGATPPPPAPTAGDYLAVLNQDPVNCTNGLDRVWRNRSSPPSVAGWNDIDVSLIDSFLPCDIGAIQASGGHANGALNIYVLTAITPSYSGATIKYPPGRSAGQIYRGVVTSGKIAQWTSASGSCTKPPKCTELLPVSDNFFVNPYDPTELYAVSVASNEILVSRDSGQHWQPNGTLTDIATNHGEYRLGGNKAGGSVTGGCNNLRGSGPFSQGCGLSGMAFDAFKSEIRVAALFYGGVAFSRDAGKDWMALDITDNNHLACWPAKGPPCLLLSNNVTQIAASVFFDGETHGGGKKKPPIPGPDQLIYVGLRGSSIRAILGPFEDLTTLNFTYTPGGTPPNVSVVIQNAGLAQTIPLRNCTNSSGKPAFCGSLLFDWQTVTPGPTGTRIVKYQYVGGGASGTRLYALTSSDISSGVANVSDH